MSQCICWPRVLLIEMWDQFLKNKWLHNRYCNNLVSQLDKNKGLSIVSEIAINLYHNVTSWLSCAFISNLCFSFWWLHLCKAGQKDKIISLLIIKSRKNEMNPILFHKKKTAFVFPSWPSAETSFWYDWMILPVLHSVVLFMPLYSPPEVRYEQLIWQYNIIKIELCNIVVHGLINSSLVFDWLYSSLSTLPPLSIHHICLYGFNWRVIFVTCSVAMAAPSLQGTETSWVSWRADCWSSDAGGDTWKLQRRTAALKWAELFGLSRWGCSRAAQGI